MPNRSFYLYRLKYSVNPTLDISGFANKFEDENSKIKQNILEINISEDEKRKHLLVILNREGNYLYGLFYKLKTDLGMDIIDEQQGEISVKKLEENKAWAEKSRLIIDLTNNTIFGEYNDNGIRWLQQPLGEYLRTAINRNDLDIEVVYDKESYENIGNKDIKSFKIKVTKPKLELMEKIFSLSGLEVFDEADDSRSLCVELKVTAGRKKHFEKGWVEKVISKFNSITDKSGIKNFELRQHNLDIPLELIKAHILKRKIEIGERSDEDIFSEIVEVYEELNLNDILDLEEDDE